MKQTIKPIKIEYCGCGAEGSILIELISHNTRIMCNYIASDSQITESLKIDSVYKAEISYWLDSVAITEEREKIIGNHFLIGIYEGKVELEGDEYFLVNSIFDVYTTNELNGFVEPATIGEWVIAKGSFFLHMP